VGKEGNLNFARLYVKHSLLDWDDGRVFTKLKIKEIIKKHS
jgi:hypothetical protein